MKMGTLLISACLLCLIILVIFLFSDEHLKGNYSDIVLKGNNSKRVIILPGMTGTPLPFEELAKKLNNDGYSVVVPLFKNHGETLSQLRRTSIQELEEQVRTIINSSSEKTIIVAECSSSLIALKLADELKLPLVLINPPLNAKYELITWLILPYLPRFDIGLLKDKSQLSRVPRFHKYPTNFLRDQKRYRDTVRLNTTVPMLIFHSKNDIRAPYSGVKMLASVAPNSEIFTLNNSGHLPYLDFERDVFYDKLKEFLDKQ
ncbi:MAG: hypothetical protein QXW00_01940 [Candidatus Woesearchaeota archaeon]